MLKISGLTNKFGGLQELNIGQIDIPTGQVTGIVGPNGAGKTTLFNTIGCAFCPETGQVSLDGMDIAGPAPHKLAHQGLVRIFQISRDLGALTILENLLLVRSGQLGESIAAFPHPYPGRGRNGYRTRSCPAGTC